MILVGGDGMFFFVFYWFNYLLNEVSFLGVYIGYLGFYIDWCDYELKELVESLCIYCEKSMSYLLLDVWIWFRDGKLDKYFLVLNELIIKWGNWMMVGDVFIKDELFEWFCGDGLLILILIGFIVYNKSIGGVVLYFSINVF